MKDRVRFAVVLLSILTLFAGCSLSYSSGTSSDSSKSSSHSSGSSSPSDEGGESDKASYMGDVSAFTARVAREGDTEDFMRELGKIAEKHGITDWERDTATYNAIGTGLRRAGITREEVRDVYFVKDLTAREKSALVLIQESYQP